MARFDMMALAGQGPRFGLQHMNELPFAHGKGDQAQFLAQLARHDIFGVHDHFIGDSVNTNNWLLTKDDNATDFVIKPASGSVIDGDTGNDNDDLVSIAGPAIYRGDEGIFFECKWQVDIITDFALEMGLIDVATDKTLLTVDADGPTPANGSDDVAVMNIDTDQTLKTLAFVAGEGSTDVKTVLTALTLPTVNTWYTTTIIVQGNDVYWSIADSTGILQDGNFVSGTEGTTRMFPWVILGSRNTTGKNILIDYITCLGIAEA